MKRIVAIDDTDGTSVADVVDMRIGLDGEWRELDLSAEHEKEFRDAIRPWWDKARRPGRNTAPSDAKSRAIREAHGTRPYWKKFRAWCDANGHSYTTPNGGFWPSTDLIGMYIEATGEIPPGKRGDPWREGGKYFSGVGGDRS